MEQNDRDYDVAIPSVMEVDVHNDGAQLSSTDQRCRLGCTERALAGVPNGFWPSHASVAITDWIYAQLYPSDYNEQIARFEAFVAEA